jgi:chorismate lyase
LSTRSCFFNHAPAWQSREFCHSSPDRLRPWLFKVDSLTRALRQRYGANFNVNLRLQTWGRGFIDEYRALNTPAKQFLLIREVELRDRDRTLVLARTVIPQATLAVAQRQIKNLGSRPLGAVLFAYPDLQRCQRQICRTAPDDWNAETRSAHALTHAPWGRRTQYSIHNHPLLVAEFFLPALLDSAD